MGTPRCATLMGLCILIAVAQSFFLEVKDEARRSFDLGRVKRNSKDEYICQFPENTSFVNFITNVSNLCSDNSTNTSDDSIYDNSEGFYFNGKDDQEPDFELAVLCYNRSIWNNTESGSDESSSESSESDESDSDESGSNESSSEEFYDKCLKEPTTDCDMKCIFLESKVIEYDELPTERKLYELAMKIFDGDKRFRKPIKNAVQYCLKKANQAADKHGLDIFDSCALMDTIFYCLEYRVAMQCPKSARKYELALRD